MQFIDLHLLITIEPGYSEQRLLRVNLAGPLTLVITIGKKDLSLSKDVWLQMTSNCLEIRIKKQIAFLKHTFCALQQNNEMCFLFSI